MIITIDGPTASGKSTIAWHIADQLKFYYLNSGLLYRALAYVLLNKNNDQESLKVINYTQAKELFNVNSIKYEYKGLGKPVIYFENKNITEFLKNLNIEQAASIVAQNPDVRRVILEYQRNLVKDHNCVADGRDTGTVVFDFAEIKFYLTASLEVRAKRWQLEQEKNGKIYTLSEAIKYISQRDDRDLNRAFSPLKPAHDAIFIDNSELDIAQTLDLFLAIIRPRLINIT